MKLIKLGREALSVRKFLKEKEIEPLNWYEDYKFNENKGVYILTYQASFKTEEEVKMFMKLNDVIQSGILQTS